MRTGGAEGHRTGPGPLATDVCFDGTMLRVTLADGREIAAPLQWFPRLGSATDQERRAWRLIGGAVGIHWEALDEDLSVAGLLSR